jgi:hypothetical protein
MTAIWWLDEEAVPASPYELVSAPILRLPVEMLLDQLWKPSTRLDLMPVWCHPNCCYQLRQGLNVFKIWGAFGFQMPRRPVLFV